MSKPSSLDPERSLGYQVRRCHRRFDRLLNAHLSTHKLKTGYWYYLRVLWIQDGLTQKALSEMTNVTENTTAAMINGMVQDDLVRRIQDSSDRRKQRIHLTGKARTMEADLMRYPNEINEIARAGLPMQDVETCIRVLAHLSRNLDLAFKNIPGPDSSEADPQSRRKSPVQATPL